jgi:hypothetical protein
MHRRSNVTRLLERDTRPGSLIRSRSEAAKVAADARQPTEAPGGDLGQVVEDGEGA